MKIKTLFFVSFLTFGFLNLVEGQIYSPQLVGHYGQRVIYYPNGYYVGNVYNGIAHGMGTYYFADGTFFYGNYSSGYANGCGMIVSPLYGYLEGYWSNGQFIGNCPNQANNHSNNQVRNIISDAQSNRTNNNNYSQSSPRTAEGWEVKKIDPDTKFGRSLLGRYKY